MTHTGHTWALILAAGEGSRLRTLTTKPCGTAVPKQFCSLYGGRTLLEDAVSRANAITATDKICTIVAEQHREWWSEQLARLPRENVISQPRNLGTAIGLLYPLLHILARDPKARVVLLPADHYVREEFILRQSLRRALRELDSHPEALVLLGVQPEEADGELGYLLPKEGDGLESRPVARFIEKPSTRVAEEIIQSGGLWNTFIIAASGSALLDLFVEQYPEIVAELAAAVDHVRRDSKSTSVIETYGRLPQLDFSRDVLERNTARLKVLRVAPCGWNDLGTPERVAETLRRIRYDHRRNSPTIRATAHLNLALQYAQLERRTQPRYSADVSVA